MGNIFYQLLEEKEPFDEMKQLKHVDTEYIQNLIKEGNRPPLSDEVIDSEDPNILAIIKAMSMCHTHDWRERPSARKIKQVLSKQWKRVLAAKAKNYPDRKIKAKYHPHRQVSERQRQSRSRQIISPFSLPSKHS